MLLARSLPLYWRASQESGELSQILRVPDPKTPFIEMPSTSDSCFSCQMSCYRATLGMNILDDYEAMRHNASAAFD